MGNRSSISHQQQQHHGLTCPSKTDLIDFQLIQFIGAGTFGKVYVVFHKGLKKEYALKVMCKRRVCRRKFTENVLSELELLQGLSHPFISSLWYAFQDNEQIYMITDLLLGGDLSYHLKNQGRFSESRAKLLICELALALDYLHRQRVGHFDVKPANILLDEQGHAHLTDFGLAKRLADGELATTFSGTRPYMAPEILLTALGDLTGYDWRVDWWALGCCFYEMLRGRTPYEYPASFSSLQVLSIIYTRGVTMPSRWPSDLISFLRGIINAEQRFRIDDFDKFQQHSYMERIIWKDVFDRKMMPIFVPPKENLGALSRRNYRATISVPLSKLHHLHHPIGQQKPFFRHHFNRRKDQQQNKQSTDGNNSETHRELDDEIAKLSTRFKKFNRFRCETQIVAPRQSLEVAMSRERRRIAAKRSPKMSVHSARTSMRTPTTMMMVGNDINKRPGRTTNATAVETQADKMRRIFHANNREVNYSM